MILSYPTGDQPATSELLATKAGPQDRPGTLVTLKFTRLLASLLSQSPAWCQQSQLASIPNLPMSSVPAVKSEVIKLTVLGGQEKPKSSIQIGPVPNS